jgi:hypothetical protein
VLLYLRSLIGGGNVMKVNSGQKANNKLIRKLAIILFTIVLINQVAFYYSETFYQGFLITQKTNKSLLHLPKTNLYSAEITSFTYLLEEVELNSLPLEPNPYFKLDQLYLFHLLYRNVFPFNNLQRYLRLFLSTFLKPFNTEVSSAIPIGGNAPPTWTAQS